jgi:hypothetical protein
MQQESFPRTSQASVSAALAAANSGLRDLKPGMHSVHPDSGRSLAEMAQRDLDAALQLLTDRAQYITGSSGAAIALRRSGGSDMLCRASSGSSAPELGTLLSTEFGLSGESVRTRRALRCDDAERDARVNQDVCREIGIASVAVMPVVHDDEVLGVFELFSGKAHAFGERDMSALQRLSEMVETAVRLARAAEGISERWIAVDPEHDSEVAVQENSPDSLEAQDLEIDDLLVDDSLVEVEAEAVELAAAAPFTVDNSVAADAGVESGYVAVESAKAATAEAPANQLISAGVPSANLPLANLASANPSSASPTLSSSSPAPSKRPLFWSAAAIAAGEGVEQTEGDRSQIPAAFRNLRQCQACGFPVSAERTLCVECEEKKWRGQLKTPRPAAVGIGSGAAAAPALDISKTDIPKPVGLEARPDLAAPSAIPPDATQAKLREENPAQLKEEKKKVESTTAKANTDKAQTNVLATATSKTDPKSELEKNAALAQPSQAELTDAQSTPVAQAAPDLVFSALEPSQSWVSRNRYVLGAILVVAATVAAILLLR